MLRLTEYMSFFGDGKEIGWIFGTGDRFGSIIRIFVLLFLKIKRYYTEVIDILILQYINRQRIE
jgi:hypothetical protein